MPIKRIFALFLFLNLLSFAAQAQEETLLSLQSETSALETGQTYTVNIVVEDVAALWGVDLQISYDPQKIYVIGTRSGSPVTVEDFLEGRTFVARNAVESGLSQINYTVTRLGAETAPVSGSGIIGSFEIYPLQAGETDIRFSAGTMVQLDEERRTGEITFTPVLLPLTITGETVEPPSEATATPMPTATIDPNLLPEGATEEPAPTELVNATPIPREEAPAADEPAESTEIPLLPIAIGLIGVGAVGLLILLLAYRRNR